MRRDEVEYHRSGYGPSFPAVNVKVPWMNDRERLVVFRSAWEDLYGTGVPVDPRALTLVENADDAYDADPGYAREVAEELQASYDFACERGYEEAREEALTILGRDVRVYSEGRSGGWIIVQGLPAVETWDAIDLGRWAAFVKLCSVLVSDIWYQAYWGWLANAWEGSWSLTGSALAPTLEAEGVGI